MPVYLDLFSAVGHVLIATLRVAEPSTEVLLGLVRLRLGLYPVLVEGCVPLNIGEAVDGEGVLRVEWVAVHGGQRVGSIFPVFESGEKEAKRVALVH